MLRMQAPRMMPTFAAKVDTTALKQALIQACIGNVKFVDHLQVMGVLCVSVDDEPLEIVVKVNDLLQKRPNLQAQQDKTVEAVPKGSKGASSGTPTTRPGSGFGTPGGKASADGAKQQSASDTGKQHLSGESGKQQVVESALSADSFDGQAASGSEPKRMRIITVGDAKQKAAGKSNDGDQQIVTKEVRLTSGTPAKEGSGSAGDAELAALQLLALKASRSSPSVGGSQASASFNNQASGESQMKAGGRVKVQYESEHEMAATADSLCSSMQVDYDVELDVDGSTLRSTKPKDSVLTARRAKTATSASPFVLRVDRRGAGPMDSQLELQPSTSSKPGAAKRGGGTIEVYNCAECSATFAMRRDLRMHVARTAHKPFKCPECARLFKDWQGLEGHALKHIGAKPWTCARCGRAYYSRPATLCHIETVHAVELEMEAQKMAAQYGATASAFATSGTRSRSRKGALNLHSQTQVQALIKRIAYDTSTKQFLAKLRRSNMTAIPATRHAIARAFSTAAGHEHEQLNEVSVKLENELDYVASNTELGSGYDEEPSGDDVREYEYYDDDDEPSADADADADESVDAYEEDEEC